MEEKPPLRQGSALQVGITFNLRKAVAADVPDNEAEYDDESTIIAIKGALEAVGCQVTLLEATPDLLTRLSERPVDIVFNIAEGRTGRGREAQIPAILNFLQIPFTGSDETTLSVALDKALTKRILASHHVKTPRYSVVRPGDPLSGLSMPFPVIVKPNAEGSGKGISHLSVIHERPELNRHLKRNLALYQQEMLVEQYISGRELTVGVLGNGPDVFVFPPMEIIYLDGASHQNIYSYEVKRDYKAYVRYECPAAVDEALLVKIKQTARRIFTLLECKDMARIDFRLSAEGELYFIEINPLPGLAPGYSDFPMMAEFSGMPYNTLIQNILQAAIRRYNLAAQPAAR